MGSTFGFCFFAWPIRAPIACVLPARTSAIVFGFAANSFWHRATSSDSSTAAMPSDSSGCGRVDPLFDHGLKHFAGPGAGHVARLALC